MPIVKKDRNLMMLFYHRGIPFMDNPYHKMTDLGSNLQLSWYDKYQKSWKGCNTRTQHNNKQPGHRDDDSLSEITMET